MVEPSRDLGHVPADEIRMKTQGGIVMATGITDYCWSVRDLLSYHVPPSRWTPAMPWGCVSHAFKRLSEGGAGTTVSRGATSPNLAKKS